MLKLIAFQMVANNANITATYNKNSAVLEIFFLFGSVLIRLRSCLKTADIQQTHTSTNTIVTKEKPRAK